VGQVLIRNVDDDTIESYRLRAKLKGQSLEQELRELLEAHRPLTPDERVATSRHLRARTGGSSAPLSKEEIREGLE
jgi:plasmid stability protein